jgi:CheY-like chemotaxis protein
MTILYVDDDADDLELVSEVLTEIDPSISCFTACDGREALTVLDQRGVLPDLILLDINMPIMDGRECLGELKKHDRFRNIPVIIYSTTKDPREINKYYEMGAQAFLRKPDSFKQLYASLSGFIDAIRRQKSVTR